MSEKKKTKRDSTKRNNKKILNSENSGKDTAVKKKKSVKTTNKKGKTTAKKEIKIKQNIVQKPPVNEEVLPITEVVEEIENQDNIGDAEPVVFEKKVKTDLGVKKRPRKSSKKPAKEVKQTEPEDFVEVVKDSDEQLAEILAEIAHETEETTAVVIEEVAKQVEVEPELDLSLDLEEKETSLNKQELEEIAPKIIDETEKQIEVETEIPANPFVQVYKSIKSKTDEFFSKYKQEKSVTDTKEVTDINKESISKADVGLDLEEKQITDKQELEEIVPEIIDETEKQIEVEPEISANPFVQVYKSIKSKTDEFFGKYKQEKSITDTKEVTDINKKSISKSFSDFIGKYSKKSDVETTEIDSEVIEAVEEKTDVDQIETETVSAPQIDDIDVATTFEPEKVATEITEIAEEIVDEIDQVAISDESEVAVDDIEKPVDHDIEINVRVDAVVKAINERIAQLEKRSEEIRYPHEIFNDWSEKRTLERKLIYDIDVTDEEAMAILDEDLGPVPSNFLTRIGYSVRVLKLQIKKIHRWFSFHPIIAGITKVMTVLLCSALTISLISATTYFGYLAWSYERYHGDDDLALVRRKIWYVDVNQEYTLLSYNIGFGCYDKDFSYIMAKGKMSNGKTVSGSNNQAESAKKVQENLKGIADVSTKFSSDFYLFQEVDASSTRSHRMNQHELLHNELGSYTKIYATNVHTNYLFYPLGREIGLINGGLMTLSRYRVEAAKQTMLPSSSDFVGKLSDLDNCITITYIPVYGQTYNDHPRYLALINVHFAAFSYEEKLMSEQWEKIKTLMIEEYEYGNYVIVGGDFGYQLYPHDDSFLGNQQKPNWLKDFPIESLPENFSLVLPENYSEVATSRSGEIPYEKGVNFESHVDGFIVSDNIKASALIIDSQFKYSDHNPVQLKFSLSKIK